MEKLKAGDSSAFELLYDRYSVILYRYIYRLLNQDQMKSEDFLHDVFLRVIENSNSYNDEYRFKTWLYTIATNLCRNEWRNLENKTQLLQKHIPWETVAKTHEDKIEINEFKLQLNQNIGEMDFTTKEIFTLRYYQDMTVKEIADIVSIPEGTVKSKLFYTLKSLSKKLNAFDPKNN